MSQDIVEQLRNAASEAECPIASLEGRAADTIESLRARVAELEEQVDLQIPAGVMVRQMKTIAAQALTIKTLKTELEKFIDSHEECEDFDGFTAQIVSMYDYHKAQKALAIPDNSTEILQEWLDKQLGDKNG